MCGIAGIWGNVTTERLKAMADALRHRGPDDEGFWLSPEAGFGLAHRRLSIIDLEGGRQPIFNEDGRIVTVFNGEIYNYRELREELIVRGHCFKTCTDTEVIVHLYEERGTDFVEKLRGMFAIALWDDVRRQLLLIRDRVGKKPLYYSAAGSEFVFASEIKGILAGGGASFPLNEQAIADYLVWGAIPAPRTVYRTVSCVQPGELLVVRERGIARKERYWKPQMLPKTPILRRQAVDQADALLQDAVRLRLRSDVPVGSFLSGGIDSGLVTAMAARQHPQPLTTITIGFADGSFDERPLARLVARRYATDHHEVLVEPHVAADLPLIVRAYDQPFGDPSAIPSYYVAQAARRYVKVVLNGDGGDELFAGYRRYVAAWISGLLAWADSPSCHPIWRFISDSLPVPRGFRSPYAFLHRLVRGMGMQPHRRYLAWTLDGFDAAAARGLHPADSPAGGSAWPDRIARSGEQAANLLQSMGDYGPVDRMLAADFLTILPDDLLVKMDIATMAHGLEARSPLLDHELAEVVARYPEPLKLCGLKTKPLLREISARYLPDEVQRAPKRGFEIPLVRWLRGELRGIAEEIILARNGILVDMFERGALERLLREEQRLDPARWSRRVWLLLMLGMWDRTRGPEHAPREPSVSTAGRPERNARAG